MCFKVTLKVESKLVQKYEKKYDKKTCTKIWKCSWRLLKNATAIERNGKSHQLIFGKTNWVILYTPKFTSQYYTVEITWNYTAFI